MRKVKNNNNISIKWYRNFGRSFFKHFNGNCKFLHPVHQFAAIFDFGIISTGDIDHETEKQHRRHLIVIQNASFAI